MGLKTYWRSCGNDFKDREAAVSKMERWDFSFYTARQALIAAGFGEAVTILEDSYLTKIQK